MTIKNKKWAWPGHITHAIDDKMIAKLKEWQPQISKHLGRQRTR